MRAVLFLGLAAASNVFYVAVKNKYPQNRWVASYCPTGSTYVRHGCGTNCGTASAVCMSKAQYGPYKQNKFLKSGGHCSCCCDCNSITVECRRNTPVTKAPTGKPTMDCNTCRDKCKITAAPTIFQTTKAPTNTHAPTPKGYKPACYEKKTDTNIVPPTGNICASPGMNRCYTYRSLGDAKKACSMLKNCYGVTQYGGTIEPRNKGKLVKLKGAVSHVKVPCPTKAPTKQPSAKPTKRPTAKCHVMTKVAQGECRGAEGCGDYDIIKCVTNKDNPAIGLAKCHEMCKLTHNCLAIDYAEDCAVVNGKKVKRCCLYETVVTQTIKCATCANQYCYKKELCVNSKAPTKQPSKRPTKQPTKPPTKRPTRFRIPSGPLRICDTFPKINGRYLVHDRCQCARCCGKYCKRYNCRCDNNCRGGCPCGAYCSGVVDTNVILEKLVSGASVADSDSMTASSDLDN